MTVQSPSHPWRLTQRGTEAWSNGNGRAQQSRTEEKSWTQASCNPLTLSKGAGNCGTGTSRSWDTPFNYGCISTYHWNCAPRCWIFFRDAFDKNHPFPWLMIFESVASNMLFLGFMMIMAMAVLDTIFYDFQKSTMIFILPFPCFTMFHCLNHQSPFSLVSYTIIFHGYIRAARAARTCNMERGIRFSRTIPGRRRRSM